MIAHERTMENSSSYVEEALHKPAEIAQEYPLSAMLLVFGAGLGVGVLLSQALAGPLHHYLQPEPTMTERLGRQMLDYLHGALPETLARQLPR
jgi:hypothetical protein